VAFATVKAPFMSADVRTFQRAIATAMETRSTCWANAVVLALLMPILMAFATMWILVLVNTTNAAFATGVGLFMDMIATEFACSTSMATASATNLK
jgi:hypothetical protein